jgi:hypothetical protein
MLGSLVWNVSKTFWIQTKYKLVLTAIGKKVTMKKKKKFCTMVWNCVGFLSFSYIIHTYQWKYIFNSRFLHKNYQSLSSVTIYNHTKIKNKFILVIFFFWINFSCYERVLNVGKTNVLKQLQLPWKYKNWHQKYFSILQGEAATGVPKRADRFVSQTAVFLAMCGIGLSMFCTRQLTEEPSTSSLVKRQK